MKKKRWRLYNIVYKNKGQGPGEIIVDLDEFSWSSSIPIGFGNLNSKTYKAVKEITGLEIDSCCVDTFYLD